jgi:mono/diheme cytochrome c family protein
MKKLNSLFVLKAARGLLVPAVAFLTLLPTSAKADGPDGAKLYVSANCVACHQANGAGVPATYPALMGNPIVAGDPDTVIKILLIGPEKVLPPGSPKFSGQMPPITGLSDAKIAAIVTYIRAKFGNNAAPVDEDEVAKVKADLPK